MQDRKKYGDLKFKVRDIHVSVALKIDIGKMMITELKSLNVHEDELTIDMSSFELNISGDESGIFGTIFKGIVSLVNLIAKDQIVNKVEEPIKDLIKEKLVGKALTELVG